jgi:hypothetical protein
MLSYTDPIVTVPEADAYFALSGDTAWTGADTAKAAAIIRGQRYIATVYNSRWSAEFEPESAPEAIKFAIMEAALRELATPGSLSPVVAAGPEKVLTGVKGITWQVVNDGSNRRVPLIPAVDGLLCGLVTPSRGSTYTASFMRA